MIGVHRRYLQVCEHYKWKFCSFLLFQSEFVNKRNEFSTGQRGAQPPAKVPEPDSVQERPLQRRREARAERDGDQERVQAVPRRDKVEDQVQQVQAAVGAADVRPLPPEDGQAGVHGLVRKVRRGDEDVRQVPQGAAGRGEQRGCRDQGSRDSRVCEDAAREEAAKFVAFSSQSF